MAKFLEVFCTAGSHFEYVFPLDVDWARFKSLFWVRLMVVGMWDDGVVPFDRQERLRLTSGLPRVLNEPWLFAGREKGS